MNTLGKPSAITKSASLALQCGGPLNLTYQLRSAMSQISKPVPQFPIQPPSNAGAGTNPNPDSCPDCEGRGYITLPTLAPYQDTFIGCLRCFETGSIAKALAHVLSGTYEATPFSPIITYSRECAENHSREHA